jgi:hypothetical protein
MPRNKKGFGRRGKASKPDNCEPPSTKTARQSAGGVRDGDQLGEKEVGGKTTTPVLASVEDISPELKAATCKQSVASGQELARQHLNHQQQECTGLLQQHHIQEPGALAPQQEPVPPAPQEEPVLLAPQEPALSFNDAVVDFDTFDAFVVNENAFGVTDKNQSRTKAAERQSSSHPG